MADAIFVDGLFIEEKETKFGKIQKLSVQTDKFKKFLDDNKNAKGYVNIDILEGKSGKKYAKLNDFVPQGTTVPADEGDSLPF